MRKALDPTLRNVLSLLEKRVRSFSGESRRSYSKAFASLEEYIIGNYHLDDDFDSRVLENWIIHNILHNLSEKTVTFYLDKISSLYSAVVSKLKGGNTLLFKDLKREIKAIDLSCPYGADIVKCVAKIRDINRENPHSPLVKALEKVPTLPFQKESLRFIWSCLALNAGVRPDYIRAILGDSPKNMGILDLCHPKNLSPEEIANISRLVTDNIFGEEKQWFAMRLRPRVKYEDVLKRLNILSAEVKLPELFYPCEEIVKQTGRRVMTSGRPVIHDIVFFNTRKSDIYPLFSKIYDVAWCYRRPGVKPGNYAPIPAKAMEDFKRAIGFLTPDFEVTPAGETPLLPGDEVVILDQRYLDEHAKVLKKPSPDTVGNKIYRVALFNSLGRWDIAIDARLLKKV